MPLKPAPDVGCFLGTRIEPGIYSAYCAQAHVYHDRVYKRWTCLLRFDLMDASGFNVVAQVPLWFNLGTRNKPHVSRRSKYFKAWIAANGAGPKRPDRLPAAVFLKRIAKVQIEDAKTELPYSVVREILTWETGAMTTSTINQSTIKEGIGQVDQRERVIEIACQSKRLAILENDEPEKVSALAGVESPQHNPTQGREAVKSLPQRHSIPDVNRAERLSLLKAQAAEVMARAKAMQVHT